jgi:outer membrane PBP1 activator LpoA protein
MALMKRWNRLCLIWLVTLLGACTASAPVERAPDDPSPRISVGSRSIERLLLESDRTMPPRSTELRLEAAELAVAAGDMDLARRILDAVEAPYATDATTLDHAILSATIALSEGDPVMAIRALENPRVVKIAKDPRTQITTGRLRAEAYRAGRSYLASARELIYLNSLLSQSERAANHEAIFATLLMLPAETLTQQAELSITSEIRGWLSLAAMTRRYQHDPLRQLNALKDWQTAWSTHPAAIIVPASLQMLSKIVEDRPENIALLLPLRGDLGKFGRAIRDGYIAAHFQLTPDTQLRIYDTSEGDILEHLARAETAGAELVIGPLDRDRVTRLAGQPLNIPVLALNRTASGQINPNLYQFGLAPEDESIQVADQVVREGHLNALVIAPDSEWGERNFQAFSERFTSMGGVIIDSAYYTNQRDYSDLVKSLLNVDTSEQRAANLRRITGERFEFSARRRKDLDFVFLLGNASQARGINPTLAFFYAEDIPVYSTSHLHTASSSRIDAIDMNGIRFCDIPWKLSEGDPIQALITDLWPDAAAQLAPFFALGVDVHRLYPRLQQLKEHDKERVFGSTGVLALNQNNVVTRSLMWGQFREGRVNAVPLILTEER